MFTPGESLIVGGKYGEISVWLLGDFAHHAEISDQGDVLALHLTADRTMLGVSRARKTDNGDSGPAPPRIRRWQAGSAGKALDPPLVPTATAAAFNTDGRYVALLDASNSRVLVHETSSGSPRAAIAGIGAVQLFALDQDGSLLATAGAGKVLTRDIASGAVTPGHLLRRRALPSGLRRSWDHDHLEYRASGAHRPGFPPARHGPTRPVPGRAAYCSCRLRRRPAGVVPMAG